jgi:predicted ATPase
MITKVEARSYRCLRNVSQDLKPFDLLIGPNASGKSSFMDVILFFSDVTSKGLEAAVSKRTENFHDLVWGREHSAFQIAIEARIPKSCSMNADGVPWERIRYQIEATIDVASDKLRLQSEEVKLLAPENDRVSPYLTITRGPDSKVAFHREEGASQGYSYELHANYSTIANLPDETQFPAATWLKNLLQERVWCVVLDPASLRMPSPPSLVPERRITGSNLARDVASFHRRAPNRYAEWEAHLKTALPDLRAVTTQFRPEDRHRYLMLRYENGVEVPSWMLSDGTLRLLALTLLAYSSESGSVYLIEEPENGVHPTAIEAIYQSLSSMYDGQALVATHSPILVSLARPEEIICFRKGEQGAETMAGEDHPVLRDWPGEVNVSEYFAAGVLG